MNILDTARELAPLVRDAAEESERGRHLAPHVAKALKEAGIFRMAIPRALGGLECDSETMFAVFEELSRADGSAGWCAMIGSTANRMSGGLSEEGVREIFSDPDVCCAGSVTPNGRATRVDGGFQASGRWPFNSGIDHCEWVAGVTLVGEGASTQVLFLIFPTAQVEVVDTWHVSGLRGTGSKDFEVHDVFVPGHRAVPFLTQTERDLQRGPLYRLPTFGFLASAVAAVPLGIARSAIDELVAIAEAKTALGDRATLAHRPLAQVALAQAEAALRSARAFFYEAVAEHWAIAEHGRAPTQKEAAILRVASTNATHASARAVDLVYEAAGSTSIFESSPMQRCFRDVHAITQHVSTAPQTWQGAGKVLMGLDADFPL